MSPGEEYETYLLEAFSLDTSETKIGAHYSTVADPLKGLGGGGRPLLIFRPNGGPKVRKLFFWSPSPPPVISGSGWPPPSPYLKVWIRHCSKRSPFTIFRTKESPVNSVELLKFCYCIWPMDLILTKWRPRLTLTLVEENFTCKYHHIVLPCLPVYFLRLNSQRPRDTSVRRWNA